MVEVMGPGCGWVMVVCNLLLGLGHGGYSDGGFDGFCYNLLGLL